MDNSHRRGTGVKYLSNRDILIDDIRVRGESVTSDGSEPVISNADRSNGQLTKTRFQM